MTSDEPQSHVRAIYIDVEMSFWGGPPPPGFKQEIIELGAVEMNLLTLQITREWSRFIRPRHWEISPKCTDLTGITKDDIQHARPFREVFDSLTEKFAPSRALCCTWGNDPEMIAAACQLHKLKSPLRNLLDLAQLVKSLFLLTQIPSLGKALDLLGLECEGVPHGALVDARSTAKVHAAVIRRMRREPDPPPLEVKNPVEVATLSVFAEKLRQSLRLNQEE
jgi:inhibitor of KinA sporulation pathway (predicted exonuclease)